MKTDYVEMYKSLEERLAQLGSEIPGPMSGFARLHKKAVEQGALSSKVKELMALAISIVVGCEGCIAYHVHDAVAAGATCQELLETIGVGILMGGGPGSIYAAHALDAMEQFLPKEENQPLNFFLYLCNGSNLKSYQEKELNYVNHQSTWSGL